MIPVVSEKKKHFYPLSIYIVNYIFVAVWATDIIYLSTFQKWVKERTFLPRDGVRVSVVETRMQVPTLPKKACQECEQKWEGSGLKEKMATAEWNNIEELVNVLNCV